MKDERTHSFLIHYGIRVTISMNQSDRCCRLEASFEKEGRHLRTDGIYLHQEWLDRPLDIIGLLMSSGLNYGMCSDGQGQFGSLQSRFNLVSEWQIPGVDNLAFWSVRLGAQIPKGDRQ